MKLSSKKAVICATQPLFEKSLKQKFFLIPLVEPLTSKDLISRYFDEKIAPSCVLEIRKAIQEELGENAFVKWKYLGISARLSPSEEIEKLKSIMHCVKKKTEQKLDYVSKRIPLISKKIKNRDERLQNLNKRISDQNTPEPTKRKIAWQISKNKKIHEQHLWNLNKCISEQKELELKKEKISRLLIRVESIISSFQKDKNEEIIKSATENFHKEGELLAFIRLSESKDLPPNNIRITTNLDSTRDITLEEIREALSASVQKSGHSVSFAFFPSEQKSPFFELQSSQPILLFASLDGIVDIMTNISYVKNINYVFHSE
ncbi:MAG: hypothetical protein N3E51_03775 [Candidatus Micrarchaeota archaeon]|nr:hypothetical protein [Candidatus Micrarchaeota archaeon]